MVRPTVTYCKIHEVEIRTERTLIVEHCEVGESDSRNDSQSVKKSPQVTIFLPSEAAQDSDESK